MNKEPILAICYDFDKTLSPDDMQAQGFIQSIRYEVSDFGKNPMNWHQAMIWTRILHICI